MISSSSRAIRTRRQSLPYLTRRRRPRGADGLTVDSAVNFAADASPFVKHAKAVAHNRNLAGGIVIPADRDFAQPQMRQIGQVNQFHIESKAINLRRFDQRPADVHAKSFEPALRVPER